MLLRRSVQVFTAAVALSVPLIAAPAALAEDVRPAAVTITYDDSQASEYTEAITAGIAVWNEHLDNVQIDKVEAGGRADVSFVSDPGWPRSELGPAMPGDSLTLPDVKPGPCSSLMSGSTGGVDCDNAVPNAEEIAAAEENYAGGLKPSDREAEVVVVG